MSTYTVECAPSDNYSAYVDSMEPGSTHYDHSIPAYLYVSDTRGSLLRYSNSELSSYRKKKIDTILLGRLIKSASGAKSGFTFSWLQSTFTPSGATYNNLPPNGCMASYVSDVYTAGKTANTVLSYWHAGDVGIDGKKAPRDFIDQIPIGFYLADLTISGVDHYSVNDEFHWWKDSNEDGRRPLTFQLEDVILALVPSFPASGGYVDALSDNTFSLAWDAFDSIDFPNASQIQIQIKDVAVGTTQTLSAAISQNLKGITSIGIDVPAGTLIKNKAYQWRGMLTLDDGTADWSDWADFSTSDAIPDPPTINYPSSEYLDGSQPIELSWTHNIATGKAQHAYDIDYQQGGDWISFANHVVSGRQAATIPANTLTAGNFVWRVRTYNSDDIAGDYAQSNTCLVRAKPAKPIIQAITSEPRTTLTWQATGQQSFQVTATNSNGKMVYDSGEVFGTAKTYQIDDFLADGLYTFSLAIKNDEGLWSDAATAQVYLGNTVPLGDDVLNAELAPGGVKLTTAVPENVGAKFLGEGCYVGDGVYLVHQAQAAAGGRYILRDGIPIAQITGDTYSDFTCSAGQHTYKLRVASGGNYYDSNEVTISSVIRYALIAPVDSPEQFFPLSYKVDEKPKPERDASKGIAAHYFDGRSRPAFDVLPYSDVSWSLEYALRNDFYDAFKALEEAGETVIIRFYDGENFVAKITGSKAVKETRTHKSMTMSFTEQDYSEAVNYV